MDYDDTEYGKHNSFQYNEFRGLCFKMDYTMNEQKLINLKLRGRSLVTVLDTDIVYAEILNRKMNVFTVQGIMYEPVDIQLYELYEFIDTHQFIYINRSTIVNIQMIRSIHKPFLYLEGTERRFEISRRRYSEVRRAYRSLT